MVFIQPMDIGQLDKSDGDDEDVNAVQHRQRQRFNDEAKQSGSKKKRLVCYKCGGMGHRARLCPSADDCQAVDEVGTDPSSDADSDLFGSDWSDDPIASINSVTGRRNRTRCGKELLAFVDSGAVDNVLAKMMCIEYPLVTTSKSQSGVGSWLQRRERSHINDHGQRRFRVKTSAGSNMNNTWKVADVRKPLISASRLLERGHKLVLDEKPRIQCKNGDTVTLEWCGSLFAVRLWIPEGFPRQG